MFYNRNSFYMIFENLSYVDVNFLDLQVINKSNGKYKKNIISKLDNVHL